MTHNELGSLGLHMSFLIEVEPQSSNPDLNFKMKNNNNLLINDKNILTNKYKLNIIMVK